MNEFRWPNCSTWPKIRFSTVLLLGLGSNRPPFSAVNKTQPCSDFANLKVEIQLTNYYGATHLILHAQTIGCFIRPATGVPAPQMYGRNNYPSHYSLRMPYYRHIPAVLKCRFRLFGATFDIQSRKVNLGQGLYHLV